MPQYGYGPPIVDLGSQLNELGNVFVQNRQLADERAYKQELAGVFGPNGEFDPNKAIAVMAKHDPKAAMTIAAQMQTRAQPHWGVNSVTGDYFDTKDPTHTLKNDAGGQNPYYTGKMNQDQARASAYIDRMAQSHKVLTDNENINTKDRWGAITNWAVGDKWANPILGKDMQLVNQAKRDFLNAVLRRESGATINPSEFESGDKQYFPQIGDSKEVIARKRENRITAMQGMARESGPGYTPPEMYNPERLPGDPIPGGPLDSAQPQEAGAGGGSQQFKEGMTATNPQTGEKLILKGGQWTPYQ